jgi:hypothetical protein
MSNPYARADARIRRARSREAGVATLLGAVVPLVAAGGALPLLSDSLYAFTRAPSFAAYVDGATGVLVRVGIALAGALSMVTYADAVRGADRGVIDVHPLQAGPWLRARVRATLRARLGWLAVAAVLLIPLAWPGTGRGWRWDAYALALCATTGAWLAGVGIGFGVNLAAPAFAERPALAGVFDAIRGPNPRIQAALLYAPGVALALSGSAAVAGAYGASAVLAGAGFGWMLLCVPVALAAFGFLLASRHAAERARLPALLGEIDAAHAAAESPDEARAVYLEWAVRFVPAWLRRELHKDLRQLWRAERPWVTGSWLLALVSGLAGWTSSPDAHARSLVVAAGSVVVLGAVGVRLAVGNPAWLDAWMPAPARRWSRAAAVLLLVQPVVLAAACALMVRHGLTEALSVWVRLESVAAVCAAVAGVAGESLRARGFVVYVPAGLLAWAVGGAL